MANFTQSDNPVHVQLTSKLSKAQLRKVKLFARDVNQTKESRIKTIKNYIGSIVRAVIDNSDHIIIVTNSFYGGNLPTQYFINIPNQITKS